MRRRIQAVARGQGRCDCGPIGIRLSRNGRPGSAVGPSGGDTQVENRVTGLLHQRVSRVVGESEIVDTFFVYLSTVDEILDTDSFRWIAPCYADGTEYDVPDQTVLIATPTGFSTMLEVTYSVALNASVVNFGVFMNGFFFYGNVEIGSVYGP